MEQIQPEAVQELIEEYKEAFGIFNISKTGQITEEEMDRVFKILNEEPAKEEIADIFDTFARNHQTLTFLEFVKLMVSSQRNYNSEEVLRDIFLMFDRNGDGSLSPGELEYCLEQLEISVERQELEDLCKEFGGEIDYLTFMKLIGKFEYVEE